LRTYVSFIHEFLRRVEVSEIVMVEVGDPKKKTANITQAGINDTSHPRYSPLYDVAEVLVVDIIVLLSN
jgi:hypothetical protein